MHRPLPRRAVLLGALSALGLTACGESSSAVRSTGPAVTIRHRFGRTVVEGRPLRVVAVGGGDMEAAIALGVVPVAGADWFGLRGTRGWVREALGAAKPPKPLNAMELSYEQVAAARPDLILYVNSLNDEAVYRKLSAIAPTVASDPDVRNAYGVPWQDQLAVIGKALDRADQAERLRAKTERLIADARAENPSFEGKTITAGVFTGGAFSVWFPSDPRMRLLEQLGFVVNEKVAALDDGKSFYVALSEEKLALMEADLIFVAALDAKGNLDPAVRDNKLFQSLRTVRSGHAVYWPGPATINLTNPGGEFSSAYSIGGPLGVEYCLPELVNLLAGGLRG